jgi:hypothetical protein
MCHFTVRGCTACPPALLNIPAHRLNSLMLAALVSLRLGGRDRQADRVDEEPDRSKLDYEPQRKRAGSIGWAWASQQTFKQTRSKVSSSGTGRSWNQERVARLGGMNLTSGIGGAGLALVSTTFRILPGCRLHKDSEDLNRRQRRRPAPQTPGSIPNCSKSVKQPPSSHAVGPMPCKCFVQPAGKLCHPGKGCSKRGYLDHALGLLTRTAH